MTVVVLGWDGLDAALIREFGVGDAFGEAVREIGTIDNPKLGKPHTYELWPTLITGVPPEVHGVRPISADTGVDWANPWLDRLSALAAGVIPNAVRTEIGRRLRDRGATLDFRTLDAYHEEGQWTVFDDRDARPIAIPNCRVPLDDDLGVLYDRGAQLGQFVDLERGPDGGVQHRPKVSHRVLSQRLVGEAGKKLGIADAAIAHGHDLVWVWLGYLDSVGHYAPLLEEDDVQRRAYERAARWTRELRRAHPDAMVLSVSDHGLQDGTHTHVACVAGPESVVEEIGHVTDVAGVVDRLAPRTDTTAAAATDAEAAAAVQGRLADLGYIEAGGGR